MSSNQQESGAHLEPTQTTTTEDHNGELAQQASMNEVDQQQESATDKRQLLEEEERKLVARHPSVQQRPVSEFLQKRLHRGQKYFDSGDYNMAKASTNPNSKLAEAGTPVTAIDGKLLNKQRH